MRRDGPTIQFGTLNQISKPLIQPRVDHRTTSFLEASRRAAIDQYTPNTLAGRGTYRGIILRVEPISYPLFMGIIPLFSAPPLWRVKARIPELHFMLPEPAFPGSPDFDGSEAYNHVVDMYPTFVARAPLPTPPSPGQLAILDFEDRQNQDGPLLIELVVEDGTGPSETVPGGYPGAGGYPYGSSAYFRNARRCGGTSTSAARGDVIGAPRATAANFTGVAAAADAGPVQTVTATSPAGADSISAYLQQNGVSQRLADNIQSARGRRAPRELWPNIVNTALVVMNLEQRTGFQMEVFSTYRSGAGRHGTLHATDVRALNSQGDPVTEEEWVFCQRVAIDLWRTEGRSLDMGLGLYIQYWKNERQIHIDTDGYRRWVHGPDDKQLDGEGFHPVSGTKTSGMSLKTWYEDFGNAYSRREITSLNDESSINELIKDAFFALVEQGIPTEADFRRIFSGVGHTGRQGDPVALTPIPNINDIYAGHPHNDVQIISPTTGEAPATEEAETEEGTPGSLFDITAGAAMAAIQDTVDFFQERGLLPPDPADQIPAAAPVAVRNCVRTVGNDGSVQLISQDSDVSSMSTGRYAAYSDRSREDVKCMVIHCTAGRQRSDPDDVVESWIEHAHRIGGLPRNPREFRRNGSEKLTAGPVSTHFVIMKDGTIVGLWDDPFAHGAWHGGPFNKASIGVDLEGDPGSQDRELTPEQYEALGELVMTREFAHLPMLGHRHFSTKTCPADPGPVPHFPWHQEPFRSRCLPHVSETALRISQGEDVDEDDDRDPGPRRNERGSEVNQAYLDLLQIGSSLEEVGAIAFSSLPSYKDLARHVDRSEVYMARAHTRRQPG